MTAATLTDAELEEIIEASRPRAECWKCHGEGKIEDDDPLCPLPDEKCDVCGGRGWWYLDDDE